MLGRHVVSRPDSVAEEKIGGSAQVFDDGQVTDPADDRTDGQTEGRHVEDGPAPQLQPISPEDSQADTAREAAQDGVVTPDVDHLAYVEPVVDPVRGEGQPTGAQERPDQGPGEDGLESPGVEPGGRGISWWRSRRRP